MSNYGAHAMTLLAPAPGLAGALLAVLFSRRAGCVGARLTASARRLFGVIATAGLSAVPVSATILVRPQCPSLTVWDSSSSSRSTLLFMLMAVVVFLPIVLAYTAFVYRVLRGRGDDGLCRRQQLNALLTVKEKESFFECGTFLGCLESSFAVSFSIINALWLEARGLADTERAVNTDEGL